MEPEAERCLFCAADADQVPVIPLRYKGATLGICPQHLPILIHEPGRLAGKLEGAERLAPSEHLD